MKATPPYKNILTAYDLLMNRAILGLLGLSLPLVLSGCADSGEAYCTSLQSSLAQVESVLYKSDELLKIKDFSQFTYDEKVERATAASEQTDLWIRMDEVGCPHD